MKKKDNPVTYLDVTDNWYRLDAESVLQKLNTTVNGLSSEDASKRLLLHGKNILPTRKSSTLPGIILRQIKSPLIYILIVAGVVSMFLGDFTDAFFIFIVVLINTVIGTVQEYKAEKSAEDLQKMIEPQATVKRHGQLLRIEATDIVPGDIISLESGMRVCADARIIRAQNLGIDESILTGESTSVSKHSSVITDENVETADQLNMAFGGSSVISGRAEAVVTATGIQTQLGKITVAVTQTEAEELPLVKRMDQFVTKLSYVIVFLAILVSVITYFRGVPILEVFLLSVALAVAAIPEGLPVALTIALTVGVKRMAKHKVIIRKLFAVEGLGSCTFIASDKTGTLTCNIQTVRTIALFLNNVPYRFDVSGDGYTGEGDITITGNQQQTPEITEHLQTFIKQSVICNEGELQYGEGTWKYRGDPVDIAFLALGFKAGLDPPSLKKQIKITAEIPYESERQIAVTFYKEADNKNMVAVKGATERVLSFCKITSSATTTDTLNENEIKKIEVTLTSEGYRVIAVAIGESQSAVTSSPVEKDIPRLTFLGFAGFIDPLRNEAKEAIAKCKSAGIKVGMITGDHPRTAFSIARELGLVQHESQLVTGKDILETESTDVLNQKIKSASVFARINPLQKVTIVTSLVNSGEFVAVTGDGVNDAPALRKANIGVAMGSGNDVAKDTSSIIITDDNFASIVEGVRQGRIAYQNLRKVIYLLIAAGVGEVLLFILVISTGLPVPLLAIQLLWLNLVTNGIQHIGIAFEKGEPGVMDHPPRNPNEGIFNPLMVLENFMIGGTMAVVGLVVWWWEISHGVTVYEARNHLLLLMVLFENYHAFNCRSETISTFRIPLQTNPILVLGVAGALGIHVLAMYLPFMQKILGTQPVSLKEGLILLAIALSVLIVSEIFKFVYSKIAKR
jgi:magnesium-transporting ATPase (P-type)